MLQVQFNLLKGNTTEIYIWKGSQENEVLYFNEEECTVRELSEDLYNVIKLYHEIEYVDNENLEFECNNDNTLYYNYSGIIVNLNGEEVFNYDWEVITHEQTVEVFNELINTLNKNS